MSMALPEVDYSDDIKRCRLVAVYGTLREGFYNNYLMEGCRKIGPAESRFWGTMYSAGGFPILSVEEPTSKIKVEIYELPEGNDAFESFYNLDRLEGYPGWYDRDVRSFQIDGEEIQAWIYTQEGDFSRLLEVQSGDWKQWKESNAC